MLTPRAHTTIINSSLGHCKAWAGGNGIATVMSFNESRDKAFLDDLKTTLLLDNVALPRSSSNDQLLLGPWFNLTLLNSGLNSSSSGIIWRRTSCNKGEYIGPLGYCEECPSYQFSTEQQYPGHHLRSCSVAPQHAYAPGGAVLVAEAFSWHGVNASVASCRDCLAFKLALDDIQR